MIESKIRRKGGKRQGIEKGAREAGQRGKRATLQVTRERRGTEFEKRKARWRTVLRKKEIGDRERTASVNSLEEM